MKPENKEIHYLSTKAKHIKRNPTRLAISTSISSQRYVFRATNPSDQFQRIRRFKWRAIAGPGPHTDTRQQLCLLGSFGRLERRVKHCTITYCYHWLD